MWQTTGGRESEYSKRDVLLFRHEDGPHRGNDRSHAHDDRLHGVYLRHLTAMTTVFMVKNCAAYGEKPFFFFKKRIYDYSLKNVFCL